MTIMKILVADDDRLTREGLAKVFRAEGFEVLLAANGAEALARFAGDHPDVVCLDVMMPGTDGYRVCQQIRAVDELVPILFITAKHGEIDRVVGLEVGADDVIAKPFAVREVVARVRAACRRVLALRRSAMPPATLGPATPNPDAFAEPFRLGDLDVTPPELRARRGETVIDLSLRDVRLLHLFHQHPGRVLTRVFICERCWDEQYQPTSRAIDQYIAQLRKKVEVNPAQPRLITTVHGSGYRYDPSPAGARGECFGDPTPVP